MTICRSEYELALADGMGPGPGRDRGRAEVRHRGAARALHRVRQPDPPRQAAARSRSCYEAVLTDCGLDPTLADAATSTEFDERAAGEPQRGHEAGRHWTSARRSSTRPGPDGEQIAFFGPVVTPRPKGEAAGKLWDGVLLVAGTPGFYEIKRTREARPIFD